MTLLRKSALLRPCEVCGGPLDDADAVPDASRRHARCVRAELLRGSATDSDQASEAVIAPQDDRKGRVFRAHCFAWACASSMWEGGSKGDREHQRPAWAMFGGSESELRAFAANARLGRKIHLTDHRDRTVEFIKSAKYRFDWQRGAAGAVVVAYLPALFALDPGMVDPSGASFVLLPGREWLIGQRVAGERAVLEEGLRYVERQPQSTRHWERVTFPTVDEMAALVPTSYLFAAYLDRRTRAPILADPRFYLRLLLAALHRGLAVFASDDYYSSHRSDGKFGHKTGLGFTAHGVASAGYAPAVAFRANHQQVEEMLAEEALAFSDRRRRRALPLGDLDDDRSVANG